MKESIGGYFSLELPQYEEFHKDAIHLNTGRNCLEYILKTRKYKCVHIPYYTCEVILEPFTKLGIDYKFYHIDKNFDVVEKIKLDRGEALLYTNYFGLKQQYVEKLTERYGQNLIVDNTQAFFAPHISGIDTFYTCRKFFGVADGAYLYTDKMLNIDLDQDVSYNRMTHLLKRIDISAEEGFSDFRKADDSLDCQPIRKMSKLTMRLMQSINYDDTVKNRRENFLYLSKHLATTNRLHLALESDAVPMVYPYYTGQAGLRNKLIYNRIFVAKYWPNVIEWTHPEDLEFQMAQNILPLPIDQRYGEKEMNRIIELLS